MTWFFAETFLTGTGKLSHPFSKTFPHSLPSSQHRKSSLTKSESVPDPAKMKFLYNRGQFHQHFKCSFYVQKSKKCKKNSLLVSHFCAFEICAGKSFFLNVGEIYPWSQYNQTFFLHYRRFFFNFFAFKLDHFSVN